MDGNFADFQKYVIDPLTKKMDSFEQRLEVQANAIRSDFKASFDQNAAMLRTITDATTGYVPRSEITLMRERNFGMLENMRKEYEEKIEAAKTELRAEFVKDIKQMRAIGGVIVSVISAMLAIFGYLHR